MGAISSGAVENVGEEGGCGHAFGGKAVAVGSGLLVGASRLPQEGEPHQRAWLSRIVALLTGGTSSGTRKRSIFSQ